MGRRRTADAYTLKSLRDFRGPPCLIDPVSSGYPVASPLIKLEETCCIALPDWIVLCELRPR